jgi:hypothetical protein
MEVKLHNGERVECDKLALMAWDDPGLEVDRRVREYRAKRGPECTYSQAMAVVLSDDPHLKTEFANSFFTGNRQSERPSVRFSDGMTLERDNFRQNAIRTPEEAGHEVDALTGRLMQKHPGHTYSSAMKAVLSDPENAEVKRVYAGWSR